MHLENIMNWLSRIFNFTDRSPKQTHIYMCPSKNIESSNVSHSKRKMKIITFESLIKMKVIDIIPRFFVYNFGNKEVAIDDIVEFCIEHKNDYYLNRSYLLYVDMILEKCLTHRQNVMLCLFDAKMLLPIYKRSNPSDCSPDKAIALAEEWLANPCEETRKKAYQYYKFIHDITEDQFAPMYCIAWTDAVAGANLNNAIHAEGRYITGLCDSAFIGSEKESIIIAGLRYGIQLLKEE